VRFAYPGRPQPVLEDLDLTLRPGERVALVGGNGAGKSTIVRLLARLCDPDAGSVCYGGIDLREFDPQQYRARLSVFCQDAAGFEFTARRNLALGALEVDEAAMLAAADRLGLRARLEALPHGLDTQLGRAFHGAVELSAGEWRKLLLARALARPADVLLLDEPFAFLDQDGQQRLAAALTGAGRERTVLIVDPRPQALTFVDRILVCEGGRIRAAAAPPAVRGERQ
jgi:ABC-type multidrug transport system fused ATPase/permease subunit